MEDIELHSNRDRIEIPSYERRGLLSPTSEESKESNSTLHYSSTSLITNFSHITIYFSMIQCCIYYIQSLFIPFISIHNPSDLLGLGDMNLSGVFYICTAISSLLFSKAWTRSFETPNALLYAMFGMISYLVLLVFSGLIFWLTPMFFTSRIGKFFGILISSYGGCFYGFQWISFYKYFIQHTNSFKDATGLSFEDINSDFISRFLSIFLLYRCVTSIAIDITRTYFLFSIQLSLCILISIGAAYASLRVSDMENLDDEEDTIATPTVSPSINAMLKLRKSHEDNFPVVKLIYKDQMIFFYLPTHITIGFMYMFIIYYFLGSRTNQINSLAMPSNNLTYLIPFLPSIVNCFVYFIFIFPISRIMKAYNKSICNVLGLICLNIIPLFILFQSNKLTLLSLDASLGFILLLLILISLCLSIYVSHLCHPNSNCCLFICVTRKVLFVD